MIWPIKSFATSSGSGGSGLGAEFHAATFSDAYLRIGAEKARAKSFCFAPPPLPQFQAAPRGHPVFLILFIEPH
jgi:hypothetical protein